MTHVFLLKLMIIPGALLSCNIYNRFEKWHGKWVELVLKIHWAWLVKPSSCNDSSCSTANSHALSCFSIRLSIFVYWPQFRKQQVQYTYLANKTNRCTEFQFYWYYDSTCFRQPFCPSSGVLSRTSALVLFMQLWWPFATRSRMELEFHPTPGSKRSS